MILTCGLGNLEPLVWSGSQTRRFRCEQAAALADAAPASLGAVKAKSSPAQRPLVVAIDGPAGAGKSTVAKGVARALGFAHLDTGAMYRALTARALDLGVPTDDGPSLAALAGKMDIRYADQNLLVGGKPPGRAIRSRRVSSAVSAVSAHAPVRHEMVRIQRRILRRGKVVAEGRDIGTVVCPEARVKVFLTASVAERARRRHAELLRTGEDVSIETLRREIRRRDRLDSTREISPLVPALDAVVVDSTGKTPHEVIAEIVALVEGSRPRRSAQPRVGASR